jgi:transcriptional regulator with XRE-family HTH domain
MPSTTSILGEYLRARRALLRPQDVGLASNGRRRVPGLRREELAMLAGISPDYYLRLEQGRDHLPSPQVLGALARALRLDEDATAHLHTIAQTRTSKYRSNQHERPSPSIEGLIASWPGTPAVVVSRYLDVLASNALAQALTPIYRPGVNIVRATFLDPKVRALVPDWERIARQAVARLRALAGANIDDARVMDLVKDLSAHSENFKGLWARHDVVMSNFPVHTLLHERVGRIELNADWLAIAGSEQMLLVYHAEPGSASEAALRRLRRGAR